MKFLFIAALLCAYLCAGAQIEWAIKAGPQTSFASYKQGGSKISTSNINGVNAGILSKVYFDDKVAFVSGLQYNAKGYSIDGPAGSSKKTYRLNYLDIPIMIQVDLSAIRGTGFYCKIGPVISAALYGREIYTDMMGMRVRNKAILSVTGNHFGFFDASLNAGVGYTFTKKLFAEALYAHGIGNINNDPNGPNIKSRVVSLSIGYFFR